MNMQIISLHNYMWSSLEQEFEGFIIPIDDRLVGCWLMLTERKQGNTFIKIKLLFLCATSHIDYIIFLGFKALEP